MSAQETEEARAKLKYRHKSLGRSIEDLEGQIRIQNRRLANLREQRVRVEEQMTALYPEYPDRMVAA